MAKWLTDYYLDYYINRHKVYFYWEGDGMSPILTVFTPTYNRAYTSSSML